MLLAGRDVLKELPTVGFGIGENIATRNVLDGVVTRTSIFPFVTVPETAVKVKVHVPVSADTRLPTVTPVHPRLTVTVMSSDESARADPAAAMSIAPRTSKPTRKVIKRSGDALDSNCFMIPVMVSSDPHGSPGGYSARINPQSVRFSSRAGEIRNSERHHFGEKQRELHPGFGSGNAFAVWHQSDGTRSNILANQYAA